MSIEDRFGETAGLEKRETQQHSIGGNLEDTGMDVFGEHYALHQNCIDCHADHHEETLKAQRDQIADVIVTGLSPFPVGQRSKGDRRNRAGQEDFDHASIQDDCDNYRKELHRVAHQQRFHGDSSQLGDAFVLKTCQHGCQYLLDIDVGTSFDQV